MKNVKQIKIRLSLVSLILIFCFVLYSCSTQNTIDNLIIAANPANENSVNRHASAESKSIVIADSAVVESLDGLLKERKYTELLAEAAKLIQATESSKAHAYIYECLSRAYFETDEVRNALMFFALAFENTENEEKDQILAGFENDLSKIDSETLSSALSHVDYEEIGDLLYQLARIKYENRKYTDAKQLLAELIESAPKHDKTSSAEKMLAHIDSITGVDMRRIGCLLPLSGPYEAYGSKALKGIMYAVTEFNSHNPNSRFEITILDTESDTRTVGQMVAELDESRVALIIGPLVHSQEAAVEAQKRNIPIITLTQKEGICEIGDYVFRHFITASMQVETLLSSATMNFGIRRFAVLYPDEPYGRTFAELFLSAAKKHGVSIINVVAYKPDQTDFGDQIRSMVRYKDKVRGHNVRSRNSNRHQQREVLIDFEALFIPDSSPKISMIAPQLEYHDVNGILLFGTNLWHSDELIASAGNYVQEAVVPDIYFGNSSAETVKRFVSGYQLQFDEPPGFMEAVAYDTTKMAFQVLSGPGLVSRDDVKISLQDLASFVGITGRTIFDITGESQKDLYLLQIIGDRFVEMHTSGKIYSYLQR
jgi:ABC-type branched-subunit amino acid transport system substrate-binding protein